VAVSSALLPYIVDFNNKTFIFDLLALTTKFNGHVFTDQGVRFNERPSGTRKFFFPTIPEG
jgi:hypothetical protein